MISTQIVDSRMIPAATRERKKHFGELDSLRGIAALAVVFYHWYHLFPDTYSKSIIGRLFELTPLQLLIGGHSSVILFYVLSGFVLSLPQVRGTAVQYPSYLLKRVCRIYLPYLTALLLAILGCAAFHGLNAYDEWFQLTWHQAPSWKLVLQHLLFIGNYDDSAYNTAFWSLVQEMRISILFPVLAFAVIRLRAAGAALLAVALVALAIWFDAKSSIPFTYSRTVACGGIFILGILLSLYLPKLQSTLRSLPTIPWFGLLLACFALYIYSPLVGFHLGLAKPAIDFVLAIGAAGIILYSLSTERISRFLLHSSISFLGRISYSVYLLHGTVLFVFAYVCFGRVAPTVWLVPYLAVTLGAAILLHRYVEIPSIQLGKALDLKLRSIRDYGRLSLANAGKAEMMSLSGSPQATVSKSAAGANGVLSQPGKPRQTPQWKDGR